ncbi:cysteine desulfurase NifS [Candidatus Micrarchaeota archaeon]|nr:cysteine desulfurase NifS [Candidatus Micrarchaeota archaeon]
MKVYLDHAATTPVDKRVLEAMLPYFSDRYGNPSSIYSFSNEAHEAVEKARGSVARLIGAEPSEMIFTSGGTEADNLAIQGTAFANRHKGNHIVTSAIEHPAVLNTCKWLETRGFEVTYLPVDREGLVSPEKLESELRSGTILISVMHANNEIGTIEPIEEIAKLARERGICLHTDAVQSIGKIPVDVKKMGVDLLSISAHKICGPKGIGALYVRKGTDIAPLAHGGGHEHGMRSGTENVPGIVGLGKAAEIAHAEMKADSEHMARLRNRLVDGALKIENSWLNGSTAKRLPNNANFGFGFIEGEALVLELDFNGIYASTGSACSSKSLEPSHVLRAIGLPPEQCHGSLRMTLGRENSAEEIDYVLQVLPKVVGKLREISPFKKDFGDYEKTLGKGGHGGHAHVY